MAPILINRAPWNALIDDPGNNLEGSLWNKAAIKTTLLDPIDVALADADDGTTKDAAQDTLITANADAIAALGGTWTNVPFNVANFWPGVVAGYVTINLYTEINKIAFWTLQLAGAPAPSPNVATLPFKGPNGRTLQPFVAPVANAYDGATVPAYASRSNLSPWDTVLVQKSASGNWTTASIYMYAMWVLPIL